MKSFLAIIWILGSLFLIDYLSPALPFVDVGFVYLLYWIPLMLWGFIWFFGLEDKKKKKKEDELARIEQEEKEKLKVEERKKRVEEKDRQNQKILNERCYVYEKELKKLENIIDTKKNKNNSADIKIKEFFQKEKINTDGYTINFTKDQLNFLSNCTYEPAHNLKTYYEDFVTSFTFDLPKQNITLSYEELEKFATFEFIRADFDYHYDFDKSDINLDKIENIRSTIKDILKATGGFGEQVELIESKYEKLKLLIKQTEHLEKNYESNISALLGILGQIKTDIKTIEKDVKHNFDLSAKGDKIGVENLVKLAYQQNALPSIFDKNPFVNYDAEKRILYIEFKFPNYEKIDIPESKLKNGNYKYVSKTKKKQLIKNSLYSLLIWYGYLPTLYIKENIDGIAINATQKWDDPSTGQPKEGVIASIYAEYDSFESLIVDKLDPESCIRDLKALVTPSLEIVSSLNPIYIVNRDDSRLIKNNDIDSSLDIGTNLAAMDWEDFEHLVAQLFEWEFIKDGAEVRVTQASRDRGVDAILFDPDPVKGGKYVIQAKRYTRTVDVSSVRDLYGTVLNEGANKGILITTSSYGPDSYEFIKDKPISLIDGAHLLNLLKNHGKEYRINLEEARKLYREE